MKLKSLMLYILVPVTFTAIYFLLFRTPIFNSQHVLFYRGNLLLVVAFILTFALSLLINKIIKVRLETLIAALILSASIHLSFFVVFPVTFDRSVTMYLLNRLNTYKTPACQGMTKEQMEKTFIKEYVRGQQAMGRRINEQSIINMMKVNDSCVSLTPRAKNFLKFSEMVKTLYGI